MLRQLTIALPLGIFPLNAACSADQVMLLPVPATSIAVGEKLEAVEFYLKPFNVSETARRNFATEQSALNGMEAALPLAAGKPVANRAIRAKQDVQKGTATLAVFKKGQVEIHGQVIPLEGGAKGQTIEVRNAASGRKFNAVVLADGTLAVIEK
jgi:flagella basal body P-ring formation protein FlgA